MIVTRIQLHCDSENCANFYPREGPVDGAIHTTREIRGEAQGRHLPHVREG
jgi:hypothetical protein